MQNSDHSHKEQESDDESPIDKENDGSSRTAKANDNEQPSKSFLQNWKEVTLDRKIELVVVMIGLFVAGLLLLTTKGQLDAMRESNEHAYRAWLTVNQVRDAPPIVAGSHAPLTAEIENTGRSPAHNVRVNAATAYQPLDWVIPNRAPASNGTSAVIGPGQSRSVSFVLKQPLSQADVDAINNGTRRIYWFADVIYSDQFSSDRLLQFCFFYQQPTKNKSFVSYPVCPSHESVK